MSSQDLTASPPRSTLPARGWWRYRRATSFITAIIVATLAGCSGGGNGHDGDGVPHVVGKTLNEADAILAGWCANVRIIVDPEIALVNVDRDLVRVAEQRFEQADPVAPVDGGTLLREGSAIEPSATQPATTEPAMTEPATPTKPSPPKPSPTKPSPQPSLHPTPTPATSAPNLSAAVAAQGVRRADPPEVCTNGRVPTAILALETVVPDLINALISSAVTDLVARGLTAKVGPKAEPTARVIRQSPASGTTVPLGASPSTVTLTPGIAVPSLIGQARLQACARLVNAGLVCAAEGPDAWVVRASEPPAATAVEPGTTVRLTLQPPEQRPAAVPSVIGMSGADACGLVERAELSCELLGGGASELVITQNPSAGTVLTLPNTVRVTTQATLLRVPNVVGKVADVGCQELEAAGFDCQQTSQIDNSRPDGVIIGQNPQPSARSAPGTIVTVTFARREQVTVPYVLELSGNDACARLERLVCQPSGDRGNDRVVRQSPPAGTVVAVGTVVTIEFEPVPWTDTWWGKLLLVFLAAVVGAAGTWFGAKLFRSGKASRSA